MNIQLFAGNFKPTFWSKYIQTELEKDLIISKYCDYKFEGEIKYGERVKIVGTVRPTIGDYVPGVDITVEHLGDNAQYLDINYSKYFAFDVEDVDKAQSTPGYLDKEFDEAKKALADKADSDTAKVAYDGSLNGMRSSSIDISAATSPLDSIDAGLVKLYKNNVSLKEELAADLNPEHITLIRKALASLFTNNVEYIKKGAIGMYNNCLLRMTNNLYNDGTDDMELIRTKRAVAFANSIDKLETCRKEKGFASIIKGLHVYGIKVVRPKELYIIKVH